MPTEFGSDTNPSTIEQFLTDNRLVVVSNREPYSHDFSDDAENELEITRPAGGLTAALDPVLQSIDGTWIAWGSGSADEAVVDDDDCVAVPPDDPAYTLRRVWLDEDQLEGYYYGFANQVLWPLCHSFPSYVEYEPEFWDRYREVNDLFADAVCETVADESTIVWFQDYHFALAPRLVRDRLGDRISLAQFWHIPWPPWDVFQRCPHGPELLTALLSNDLLGFHTEQDCDQFGHCAAELIDATYDPDRGVVSTDGRETRLVAAPIQIDAEPIAERARSSSADAFWERFSRTNDLEDRVVLLGVDRLDYTKGIPQRMDALELLWEEHPSMRERVTYVQKGSESRSRIPAYQRLQDTVAERIEEINDRFGTDEWQPIVYCVDHLSLDELQGLYQHADVALVTPVKDGLNLVAKEFVAATDQGVLVLSDSAGVAEELGEYALTVTPMDVGVFAERIRQAVDMPPTARRRHTESLQSIVDSTTTEDWLTAYFAPLASDRDSIDEVSTIGG